MALDDVYYQTDTPVARRQVNTLQPKYIPARILWPALGFPEMVNPSAPTSGDDHTACIHLLVIAASDKLSRYDVARHLRWVSWQQRRTRFLPVGDHSFPAEQITVNPVFFSSTDSDLTYQVVLAAKKIAVALAKRVWKFYSDVWKGSAGIYEVMISQAASSAPPAGLNNLIWVNRDPTDTEDKPSEEMRCLLEKFVKPRLANEFPLGKWAEIRASVPYKDSNDMALY